jgi:uncharacterized membrane protein YuzA (DUF378 family)
MLCKFGLEVRPMWGCPARSGGKLNPAKVGIQGRNEMKVLYATTAVLLVIGGLNWGLWGLFEFDLVAAIFGGNTAILSKIVYVLVGLAAVYQTLGLSTQRRQGALPATT